MGAWDNLSIREKADMMRVAIRNGITTLPEIKQAYNEFAEGGNIYGNGGSKKSGGSFYQTHKARWNNYLLRHGVPAEQAARLSGFFSAQDALESGHGTSSAARQKNNFGGMQRLDKKTNKMVNISYPSIDAYMDAKWKMMRSRFGRALNAKTAQEYSDSLNNPKYHGKGYMYALYEGYRDGQPLDVARQTKHMNNYTKALMSIAGEKGFKASHVPAGSQSREVEVPASIARPENPYIQFVPFTPFNPQAFGASQAFVAPTREELEIEQPLVEAANDYAYSPEQLEKEERRQGLNNFSFILGMMNGGNGNSFADTIGMLTGNIAAEGGPIHIKPENRGKFTALKERTGHSATWFKEHGTPAQRKMATFALNARHWKHGYGGHIYDGTSEDTQQMDIPYAGELPDVTVIPRRIANKAWDKVQERWVGDMPTYYAVNPETGKEEMLREIGNGKYSTYDDKHVFDVLSAEAAKKEREQWIKNGGTAGDFDKVMLGTLGLGLAPIALPEIAAGVGTALTNPYVDAGLTSYFGAHGLDHAINEGINGWRDAAMTALELAPLGRLAKPMWNAGKGTIAEIQALYNNYPIRNYNIDAILKSDFYDKISEQYGKEFADDLAQKLTSKEFRNYLFGDNPRKAFKAADRHLEQMQFIKDVENAGGLLGGSGELARAGTVNREGLMHDLDFFIPGSMENKTSPVVDALGLNKHNEPLLTVFGPTGTKPKVFNNTMGSVEKGYVNLPQERGNVEADMFIRDHMPTEEEAVDIILDAKRQFGRPKDTADIEAFKPYSSTNPIIDISTGQGQWNPTLFDRGIFTKEGYPFVQSVETYPGSGVRVPAVMNYKGQIKALNTPIWARTPQITAENAASMTPEQWTAAQDAAIARGDMAEAQRLRDLHFGLSDSKYKEPLFRGTDEDSPIMDLSKMQVNDVPAVYLTPYEGYARQYGDNVRRVYLNTQNPWIDEFGKDYSRFSVDRIKKSLEKAIRKGDNAKVEKYKSILNDIEGTDAAYRYRIDGTNGDLTKIYEGTPPEILGKDVNKIKSADAVTYDDKGVRIPLGERDNFNISDIRYGLIPFGIGLTGYGLYNSGK